MNRTAALRVLSIGALALAVGLSTAPLAQAKPPNRAPAPKITAGPPAATSNSAATFAFTSTLAKPLFQCSLDGARYTTCTSPKSYSSLRTGTHSFAVRVSATGFKTSTSTVRTWAIDRTPPNAPTVATPSSPNRTNPISIAFSSSSTDVASYLCSLDGAAAAACTSPAAVTLTADGWHTLSVVAVDRAGNKSGAGSATWLTDTSTPTPVVSSGPPSLTPSSSANFTYASAEGDVTFACSLDGGPFTACASGGVTYTGLANGSHSFAVRTTDEAGNTATSDTFSWVRGATAKTLAWSSTPAAVSNASVASFGFTSNGAAFTCSLDGASPVPCASPWAVSSLSDGSHTVMVITDPGVGQVSLTFEWVIDTQDPGKPVITGPSAWTNTTSAKVVVRPAASDDSVACTLDAVATPCAALANLTGLAVGAHTVTATATDPAGNTATTSFAWTIDQTAPTATATRPTSVTSPFVVRFNEPVTALWSANVVLKDQNQKVVSAARICRSATNAIVACSSTSVRSVGVIAAAPLVANETYSVVLNPTTTTSKVRDRAGNAAAPKTFALAAPRTVQDSSLGARQAWAKVTTTQALGGSQSVASRQGASATWRFTGSAIGVYFGTGPSNGTVDVIVDGKKVRTWKTYSSTTNYRVLKSLTGLSNKAHTITLRVTGSKGGTPSRGTAVAFDGYRVGSKITSTPSATARWARKTVSTANGGTLAVDARRSATAGTTFRGTKVSWVTYTCASCGIATVSIDGKVRLTVDTYSARSRAKVSRTISGLTTGRHTITVTVTGNKRSASKGSSVHLDALIAG